MAVTYPLALPTTPVVQQVRFGLKSNTTVFSSPLTRTEQVLERPGRVWMGQFSLPPMVVAEARDWAAFFLSLRGRRGTFNGFDPSLTSPRGTAPGTPLVKGASQTGNLLITDGWTISQTGILLAGDYFAVNSRFHMVVEDANSDGSGDSTLVIEPPLRESPSNNAPLTTASPKCVMRLASDDVGWDVQAGLIYGMSFNAVEVL